MRYKEIKDKILGKYDSLPKNQKKIAEYCIDNFDKIPFLSVQDVSTATDTSVASIVRFSQRIGFKGFLELRDEVAQTLQTQIEKKELFSLIDQKKLKDDTLTHIANQDIENINKTIHTIDRKSFKQAVKMILASERIYTAGLGISYLLSEILSYQLTQIGINSSNFTKSTSSFLEQALYVNKKDTLITFSFPPFSKETIELAKQMKNKGVKVISITNSESSPITFYSDLTFVVSSKNTLYTNSFSAISVIINALTTECAFIENKRATNMLEQMNEIAEKLNSVIDQ